MKLLMWQNSYYSISCFIVVFVWNEMSRSGLLCRGEDWVEHSCNRPGLAPPRTPLVTKWPKLRYQTLSIKRPTGIKKSHFGRVKIRCSVLRIKVKIIQDNFVLSTNWDKGRHQRKKRDYVWKFPSGRPPPPQFGKPLLSKKKVGFIFHFRTSGTFFVFTKKSPFWVIDWNYVVGMGETPPPRRAFSPFSPKRKHC